MTRTLPFLAFAAAALAGCDSSPETIGGGAPVDPRDADQLANAVANVQLPPAIVASHAYRCKDNTLVYIDWMSDGGARAKTDRNARATTIAVGGENPVLTGDRAATTVTYQGQSCSR